MSVAVRSLIGGAWVTGSDGTLTDTNPARPDEVVATDSRLDALSDQEKRILELIGEEVHPSQAALERHGLVDGQLDVYG